jgi:plasmid stabilization system protein ParE
MTFSVVWTEDAEDSLADVWLQSAVPNEVTRAQARIDRQLASDPKNLGTPMSEGLYRLTDPPLTVLYSFDEDTRAVEVSAVRSP